MRYFVYTLGLLLFVLALITLWALGVAMRHCGASEMYFVIVVGFSYTVYRFLDEKTRSVKPGFYRR